MTRETLLHIDQDLAKKDKEQLLKNICHECGDVKPHFVSKNPRMMFVSYDDRKVNIHDLPGIANKYGTNASIVDF
ncbi:MAG: hypothetical protein OEV78_12030 [Spirochaetia bacterium]|nr:hypothetical protein [Spirochaetia bacterium]